MGCGRSLRQHSMLPCGSLALDCCLSLDGRQRGASRGRARNRAQPVWLGSRCNLSPRQSLAAATLEGLSARPGHSSESVSDSADLSLCTERARLARAWASHFWKKWSVWKSLSRDRNASRMALLLDTNSCSGTQPYSARIPDSYLSNSSGTVPSMARSTSATIRPSVVSGSLPA